MIEIEQRPELLITLPKRGLRIVPPPETAANMQRVRSGERIEPWTDREKARLSLIRRDTIMKKRFPDSSHGNALMNEVCYSRREELLEMARDLSDEVVARWRDLHPDKNIAVVLFGSVARGLVRNRHNQDPSNIDIAVLGNFSDEERTEMLDAIRPARLETRDRILKTCEGIESFPDGSGNAGVFVQDVSKVINNKFAGAKEYIASSAMALYDPSGIWEMIETAALDHEACVIAEKRSGSRQKVRPSNREQVVFTS
jgi:predicted nucleotidyltransferase